jgi:hypothetical protein
MDGGLLALEWPANLKRTPTRLRWFEKFSLLPANLDLKEVSDRLAEPYATVYRWADTFAYPFPDRRRRGRVSMEQWENVDWAQRDAHIARILNISRERVRQVRCAKGVGPSAHRAVVRKFEQFVTQHMDRLHGRPVVQVMSDFGANLSVQVARRVLRTAGVEPHDPASKWKAVDWRLTNRDLAEVWGTSAKYVANVRARLGVGPAQWDARSTRIDNDPNYQSALAQERERCRPRRRTRRNSDMASVGLA